MRHMVQRQPNDRRILPPVPERTIRFLLPGLLIITSLAPANAQTYLRNDTDTLHASGITLNEVLARSCCKDRVGFDYNGDEITSSSLDKDEFVEIVNTDRVAIDINGWQLADNNDTFTLSGLNPIPPQRAVILFTRNADVSNFDPGPENQVLSIPTFDLDNGEDLIALSNTTGLYVAVYWGNQQPLPSTFIGITPIGVDSVQKAWNGIAGTSITRTPDFTGDWTEHAEIIGDRTWSTNAEVILRNPRASPGRSFRATPLTNQNEIGLSRKSITLHAPYPNPANDWTTLHFSSDRSGPLDLRIIDTIGREVYRKRGTLHSGQQQLRIETAMWASGIYLISINRQTTSLVIAR